MQRRKRTLAKMWKDLESVAYQRSVLGHKLQVTPLECSMQDTEHFYSKT